MLDEKRFPLEYSKKKILESFAMEGRKTTEKGTLAHSKLYSPSGS